MSCNSSFIGIYKDASDNPLIGICLGITGDGLDLKYYDANTREEVAVGSGDVLTCCSGSFEQNIRGLSCNSVLIGVFVDVDENPLFAKFDGIKGGIAILTYYSADTGEVYVGTVYYCCAGGGGAVADGNYGDITVSSSGTVWAINNNAVTSDKIANSAVTNAKIASVDAIKVTEDTTHRFVTDTEIANWNSKLTQAQTLTINSIGF